MVNLVDSVILWNYGFPEATPFQDVFAYIILSLLFIIIKLMRSQDTCIKCLQEVKIEINYGFLGMGIHYDYKSTRGDKAMKKEAKRKASRIEQRRAKRANNVSKPEKENEMHDIDKPITLEDLTNSKQRLILNEIFLEKKTLAQNS